VVFGHIEAREDLRWLRLWLVGWAENSVSSGVFNARKRDHQKTGSLENGITRKRDHEKTGSRENEKTRKRGQVFDLGWTEL
jgi:hypothetical protein